MAVTEIEVLRAIAKGHPERNVTATTNGHSRQVSGLTWEEIQVAVHASFTDIAGPISELVGKKMIDSGREYPTLLGKLAGQKVKTYFWLTASGRAALDALAEPVARDNASDWLSRERLAAVEALLGQLGFDLTPYGAGVAQLSLGSGFSNAETASHIALATVARDVRESSHDLDGIMYIAIHARSMLAALERFHTDGLMRSAFVKNDGRALIKVAIPSPEQAEWIDRVLSDEVVAKERMATSISNYRPD